MKRIVRAGTTLVELLVVIVVFLIGILAVLQIFPGGLRVLSLNRSMSMATQLARAEQERLNSRPDILPEMILPVKYSFVGSTFVDIFVDQAPNPNDLGPPRSGGVDGLTPQGMLILNGQNIGRWDMIVAANRTRRVVGEGGRVPSPRQVGTEFGGLMMLQFAPISWDPNPAYSDLLTVYGNDMVRRWDAPGFRVRPWEYFVEDAEEPAAMIHVPRDPTPGAVDPPRYRLTMSAWIQNGGSTFRRTIIDSVVNGTLGTGFDSYPLDSFAALQPGDTFLGAEFESIRLSRLFRRVANFTQGQPYEYKLLDSRLGVLLFNPAGHDFEEIRPGRRLPLVARTNYDVFDWRIIRDDFRIADTLPLQQRLQLTNLKVPSTRRPDGLAYGGLDVPVADGSGGTEQREILLIDMETGGVYTRNSFLTDTSAGVMKFVDTNPGLAGLQMQLIYPGQSAASEVTASGRAVRALYQAVGEWAVQVLMAPEQYSVTYSQPSVAQYYVGGSSAAGGGLTRIYFPSIDVGRKVVIGEIYYRDGGGNLHSLRDQDFVIQNTPADPLGAYVDITTVDPNAATVDFTAYGYAVRRVKGSSLGVRVLWNPAHFILGTDDAENLDRFDTWGRNWRRTTVETFLQRGEN